MDTQVSDLDSLIFSLFDGSITPEEHSRLQVSLKNLPEARERYHTLVELHSLLEHVAEQQYSASSLGSNIIPMEDVVRRQRRRFAKRSLLATAAVILFSAFLLQFILIEKPDLSTASTSFSKLSKFHFTHIEGERKDLSHTLMRKGSTLELEQGTVQLNFATGVEAYVQSPARITLTDELNLEIKRGTAWFNVPPAAKGFSVSSERLKVIDLGTQFGVIVDGDSHEVHVFKGLVEAESLFGKKETFELSAGQARQTNGLGQLKRTELDESYFLTHLPKGLTYLHWNFSKAEDGSFITEGNAPTTSKIESRFTKELPSTENQKITFKPGTGYLSTNWSGIDADRPRTITGWIKCPPHKPHNDAAITEWGVTRPYAVSSKWRVTINPGSGASGALRTEFGQGFIVGTSDLRDGKWHHFASVYDGSGYGNEDSIQLYIDGSLEAVSRCQPNTIYTVLDSEKSTPCRIGRNFTGSIGNISIYNGVLPAREILRQAKSKK